MLSKLLVVCALLFLGVSAQDSLRVEGVEWAAPPYPLVLERNDRPQIELAISFPERAPYSFTPSVRIWSTDCDYDLTVGAPGLTDSTSGVYSVVCNTNPSPRMKPYEFTTKWHVTVANAKGQVIMKSKDKGLDGPVVRPFSMNQYGYQRHTLRQGEFHTFQYHFEMKEAASSLPVILYFKSDELVFEPETVIAPLASIMTLDLRMKARMEFVDELTSFMVSVYDSRGRLLFATEKATAATGPMIVSADAEVPPSAKVISLESVAPKKVYVGTNEFQRFVFNLSLGKDFKISQYQDQYSLQIRSDQLEFRPSGRIDIEAEKQMPISVEAKAKQPSAGPTVVHFQLIDKSKDLVLLETAEAGVAGPVIVSGGPPLLNCDISPSHLPFLGNTNQTVSFELSLPFTTQEQPKLQVVCDELDVDTVIEDVVLSKDGTVLSGSVEVVNDGVEPVGATEWVFTVLDASTDQPIATSTPGGYKGPIKTAVSEVPEKPEVLALSLVSISPPESYMTDYIRLHTVTFTAPETSIMPHMHLILICDGFDWRSKSIAGTALRQNGNQFSFDAEIVATTGKPGPTKLHIKIYNQFEQLVVRSDEKEGLVGPTIVEGERPAAPTSKPTKAPAVESTVVEITPPQYYLAKKGASQHTVKFTMPIDVATVDSAQVSSPQFTFAQDLFSVHALQCSSGECSLMLEVVSCKDCVAGPATINLQLQDADKDVLLKSPDAGFEGLTMVEGIPPVSGSVTLAAPVEPATAVAGEEGNLTLEIQIPESTGVEARVHAMCPDLGFDVMVEAGKLFSGTRQLLEIEFTASEGFEGPTFIVAEVVDANGVELYRTEGSGLAGPVITAPSRRLLGKFLEK